MKDPDDRTLLDELLGEADDEDESDGPGDSGSPPPDDRDVPRASYERHSPVDDRRSAARRAPLPRAPARTTERHESAQRPGAGARPRPRPRPIVRRPAEAPGCRETGLTIAGFVIFVSVDSVMMYTPFRTAGAISLLPQALTLLLLAFGLGGLMVWNIRGACRPVGIGLMVGWIFMTLISAGFFTGLNP